MRPPLDRSRLDEAKRRVPLSTAARALGLGELKPRGVQRSPFREDRHPSFSVTGDALWRDHATGEGGDVVSFIVRASGCEDGEAIKRLLALAGLDEGLDLAPLRLAPRPPAPPPPPKRDALRGLDLRFPSVGELARIQHTRRWPVFAGLEIAARRGLLHVADIRHRGEVVASWVLTDAARRTGWARRMDGEEWQFRNNRAKANSLRSDPDAPPGLADVTTANRPAALIIEGEVDTLAALTFAWLAGTAERVGVVCVNGASRGIPPAVRAALTGRRVRILRQSDKPRPDGSRPSHSAAAAWLKSLHAAGIAADVASLDGLTRPDGTPAKDTADLLDGADLETLSPLAAALCAGLL